MLPYNLGRFGNGITIWLGIQPYGTAAAPCNLVLCTPMIYALLYRENQNV